MSPFVKGDCGRSKIERGRQSENTNQAGLAERRCQRLEQSSDEVHRPQHRILGGARDQHARAVAVAPMVVDEHPAEDEADDDVAAR